MNWIPPRTIIGSPAEGAFYLRRQYINDEFWRLIKNGENILFSAPRRVGKSSVMKDLERSCPDGYFAIYQNIEADRTQSDLFKRLFMLLIEHHGIKGTFKQIGQWLRKRSIGEISAEGTIKFEARELNYKEELLNLIEALGKEKIKVVMLLDEFPDVIQSIKTNEGANVAIDTLHTLRSIRHDKKLENYFFVFAGSVGIDHVVASLDRPKLINDIPPIHIGALTTEEAHELLIQLLSGATMQMGEGERSYLVGKINYLLPYYIQLMVEKCNSILHKESRPALTTADIDTAYLQVIKEGRNFSDWEERLKKYLDAKDCKYCIAILTRCAHREPYSIQQAYNFSKKQEPTTGYKQLIDDVLVKDGYLIEESGSYRFLSPFLKEWWKSRHPEFEIED